MQLYMSKFLLINFKILDSIEKFGQVNKVLSDVNKTILFNEL